MPTLPPSGARSDATAAYVRRPPPPPPLAALVRVLATSSGAPPPPPYRLQGGRCVIGSGAGCDVIVNDATVSRTHVELELVPEGVRVRDLGSMNGTFFLGHRVEQMVLALGGRIEAAGATIAIDADEAALHGELSYAWDEYRNIVGSSAPMHQLFALLTRLEGSLATVLIEGESGVGKELVATALHDASSVSDGPFVAINCGAFSRELVASELFGHRRGAFSGAHESRKGAFESADRGTLFLDEVGELPLEVQPVLLRALEAGEVRPVGDDQPRRVTVRLIAATNRDLLREVRDGSFREDLYYRLSVVRLVVPPLRDRVDDIEPLAHRFARDAGLESLPGDVVARLVARPWPGNVRELRNAIQAYAAVRVLPDGGGGARPSDVDRTLGELVDLERPYLDQRDELVDRFTRQYLELLLARTGNNQTQAARIAGLDRTYFGRLLSRHGTSRDPRSRR